MQPTKRRRLSAEAWRAMVAKFSDSGLTTEGFCQQERVSLASLRRWQAKLPQASAKPPRQEASSAATAPFVDLGALRSGDPRIELRLEFGGGIVLHLSRS